MGVVREITPMKAQFLIKSGMLKWFLAHLAIGHVSFCHG
jgi:hypothetical protein